MMMVIIHHHSNTCLVFAVILYYPSLWLLYSRWLFPDMSDVGEKLLLGNDVGEEKIVLKIPIVLVQYNNKNHNLSQFYPWKNSATSIDLSLCSGWYHYGHKSYREYRDESRRMRDNNHNDGIRWRGRWARWCRLRAHVEAAQNWGDHHQHKKQHWGDRQATRDAKRANHTNMLVLLFLVGSNFRCFCANSMRFTLIFGVYLLI